MLYIVATPIGNLSDITNRALETLKTVDLVLCEDTRNTKKLLDAYEIKTPTMSYHQHSGGGKMREIIDLLDSGKNIALVTDAGTPGISDPGNELVQYIVQSLAYRQAGSEFRVIPIPGPSAVVTALSISGFPTDKFMFMGFPPHKNKRKKFFEEVASCEHTVALYESNHRIKKTLTELQQMIGDKRQVCVCRELTKQFETIYRGTLSEIISMNVMEKGEFVVIVKSS